MLEGNVNVGTVGNMSIEAMHANTHNHTHTCAQPRSGPLSALPVSYRLGTLICELARGFVWVWSR